MPAASPPVLRKFGLSVGGVFLAFAALSWWRGHVIAPAIMGTLGVPLVVLAVLVPTLLGPIERRWMAMAGVLGRINARVILTVLYYAVITPVGWLRRRSDDPLDRAMRDGRPSNWVQRERLPVDPARYRQQF